MVTIQEVFEYGDCLDDYPCDLNEEGEMESNGSIELKMEYEGQIFFIRQTWLGEVIEGEKEAIPIDEEEKKCL